MEESGNTIIWKTTNSNIKAGDVIRATVKAHTEYRGEKQTVVTRGKIVNYARTEENSEDAWNAFCDAYSEL